MTARLDAAFREVIGCDIQARGVILYCAMLADEPLLQQVDEAPHDPRTLVNTFQVVGVLKGMDMIHVEHHHLDTSRHHVGIIGMTHLMETMLHVAEVIENLNGPSSWSNYSILSGTQKPSQQATLVIPI